MEKKIKPHLCTTIREWFHHFGAPLPPPPWSWNNISIILSESLKLCIVLSCAYFRPRHSPLKSNIWNRRNRFNFYVFISNVGWAENWTHHLPDNERIRYVLRHNHWLLRCTYITFVLTDPGCFFRSVSYHLAILYLIRGATNLIWNK